MAWMSWKRCWIGWRSKMASEPHASYAMSTVSLARWMAWVAAPRSATRSPVSKRPVVETRPQTSRTAPCRP